MATRISPTRSLGSSSREQWNDISCSSASVQNFPESNSTPSPIRDDTQASARQVGSGSRSQWTSLSEPEAFQRSSTELDLALGDAPMAMGTPSDDDSDDLSAFLPSEATYDHSMATARTGHVSNNSAEVMHTVTPESSPKEARSSRRGRSRSETIRYRSQSPEELKRSLICGTGGVNDELKESIKDVNATVRQIFTTVRRFGPDEKDALRETIRDASCFMRDKISSTLLRKKNCVDDPMDKEDDDDDDDDEMLSRGSSRRGGRRQKPNKSEQGNSSTSSVSDCEHQGRRGERGVKSFDKERAGRSTTIESQENIMHTDESGVERGVERVFVTRMLV